MYAKKIFLESDFKVASLTHKSMGFYLVLLGSLLVLDLFSYFKHIFVSAQPLFIHVTAYCIEDKSRKIPFPNKYATMLSNAICVDLTILIFQN